METLDVVLYGIIQGATEFLPVSSSGHLALLPHFLHFNDPGVVFDLAMHVGTALAIILYFKKEIKDLLLSLWPILRSQKIQTKEQAFSANMIIATFVTGILALLLKDFALTYGRSPKLIAFNLAFFGLFMAIADKRADNLPTQEMDKLQVRKSFLIGLFQVLAIFPGVSRSGATLSISRFLELSRHEASRFSFLLSTPLIFAGTILEFIQVDLTSLKFDLMQLLFGVGISFLIGLLTIHYFLKWISKVGLIPFAFYRIVLAMTILWLL